MKRIICLIIAVFMVFCLLSCDKGQQVNSDVVTERKPASYSDILSAFESAGYESYGYSASDLDLASMKSYYGAKSVEAAELFRENYYSQYDEYILDECGLTYFEFIDEQSAIEAYDKLVEDFFDSRPTEKYGNGYSKAFSHDKENGLTEICSRIGSIVVCLWNDYDDYCDTGLLTYDNKPELIIAELGY